MTLDDIQLDEANIPPKQHYEKEAEHRIIYTVYVYYKRVKTNICC